jgi:hypothetical protein
MRGTYGPELPKKAKLPNPATPQSPFVACIAGDPGRSRCGRDLDVREYVFNDADYTIATRENDPHLRVCPACVAKVQARKVVA